jgi:predicted transcriptional regulator
MNRARRAAETRLSAELAEQVADVMFALSTASRVQILAALAEGTHTVSELTERLGIEQSAVSHQLRVLREHGARSGRRRAHRATPGVLPPRRRRGPVAGCRRGPGGAGAGDR